MAGVISGNNAAGTATIPFVANADGSINTRGAGSSMELYGASTATRPLATAVPAGTTFIVVADPLVVYMSNGTDWVEV